MSLADDLIMYIRQAREADLLGDSNAALNAMEQAKRLYQELYYDIWMRHHTSGTGK